MKNTKSKMLMTMFGKIGFSKLPMQAPNKFMGTSMAIKS